MNIQPPLLIVNDVTKTFPGVVALDKVSFDIRPGEVHALVGENGAGKSTLMKVLAGLYKADAGEIIYKGEPVHITSPLNARQQGILLIHQELSLSPELSVAENIYLGAWPTNRFGVLRKSRLNKDAQAALTALGADFGPNVRLGALSIAKQQMVEIARANAFEANVVIFDEPTASLTDTEKDLLFATIRNLRDRGVGGRRDCRRGRRRRGFGRTKEGAHQPSIPVSCWEALLDPRACIADCAPRRAASSSWGVCGVVL